MSDDDKSVNFPIVPPALNPLIGREVVREKRKKEYRTPPVVDEGMVYGRDSSGSPVIVRRKKVELDEQVEYAHFRIPTSCVLSGQQSKNGRPCMVNMFRYYPGKPGQPEVSPTGGATYCKVTWDGNVGVGVALCSMSDNFNYATGRQKAHFRAKLNMCIASLMVLAAKECK